MYGATAPVDLEGIRWVLFAEMLASDAKTDIEGATRELDEAAANLDDESFQLGNPSAAVAKLHAQRRISVKRLRIGEARVKVAEMASHKEEIRAVLWPADEPVEGETPVVTDG